MPCSARITSYNVCYTKLLRFVIEKLVFIIRNDLNNRQCQKFFVANDAADDPEAVALAEGVSGSVLGSYNFV